MFQPPPYRFPGVTSAFCAAILAFTAPAACAEETPLSSAAVDYSLYRDGEVTRASSVYGSWTVVCDEIRRLHQRFCSLKTALRDAEDRSIAEITVSTGDNGQPAALIRTALGAYIGKGLQLWVETPPQAATKAKPAQHLPEHRLDLISCDAKGCAAIWAILPGEISALNQGASLHLRLTRVKSLSLLTPVIAAPERLTAVEGAASGFGFAQAVASTLK